MNMTG